jgi:hypothetical protein
MEPDTALLRKESDMSDQWIPVSERLPEQREHVIGWGVDFARPAEVWIGGDGAWYGGDFEQAGRITHWMPLPDLPAA